MRLQAGRNLKEPDYHKLSGAKTRDLSAFARIAQSQGTSVQK
jgi:hypothetical protein